jgi:hypothetical protein
MVDQSIGIKLKATVFTPVLASLLQERWQGLVLVGAGLLHVGLSLAGLPGWRCPFKAATGIPCPGCGLTAAIEALLHGDWRSSLSLHAFAPIFSLAFAVMAFVSLLPETARQRAILGISSLEKRTGITAWVLFCLVIYWVLRLPGLV